jgi:hypothetical protein
LVSSLKKKKSKKRPRRLKSTNAKKPNRSESIAHPLEKV